MIVISGSSHLKLSTNIGKVLGSNLILANISHFEDNELQVQIEGEIDGQDVAIICSTAKPANDKLMELLLLIDTARRAGAKSIIAIIPYFGYSRQDRITKQHQPISASLVAKLLQAAGAHRVITLDLHSKQTEGFFEIGVDNIDPSPLFAPLFEKGKYIIVSPDVGGVARAQKFSQILACPLAVVNKTRVKPGDCEASEIMGEVQNKHCLIIDDIVDTANTICKAAELLMQKGALSVSACVTHAVFSKGAIERLKKSPIDRLFISNSIMHKDLHEKIQVMPIDELIVNSIRCLI